MHRAALFLVLSLALSGCSVAMYGNQSTSGGTTTTITSTQVSGSVQGANYRVAFSSGGQPVSPRATGGHVYASGSSAYVVMGIVAFSDLVNYIVGVPQAKPLPPGTRIADTCSCYKKE
jgi:hypothetical protein